MKKYILLYSLLFGTVNGYCQNENPSTNLLLNLATTEVDQIELFHLKNDIFHLINDSKTTLSLSITEAVILNLVYTNTHHYIHIKPGETLQIDSITDNALIFGGKQNPSKENKYLAAFAKITSDPFFEAPVITKETVGTFLHLLNEKYRPLAALVTNIEADKEVSQTFKDALKTRLIANRGKDLLLYKSMHTAWHKKEPTLPVDFYQVLENLDFTNPDLMLFEVGRNLGNSWNQKEIDFKAYASISDYFAACIEGVTQKYGASLMKDYAVFQLISNNINFGGGIDAATIMIANFKSSIPNQYLNYKLNETIAPWKHLKSGMAAPDFLAKKRNKEEVRLADLKGKKVYIDIWATWCAPCIKELPALKALAIELREENIEFVSVSIDKIEAQEKWATFIDEMELSGLQLFAYGDWQSDIVTAYNIKGIPRFLLIGADGKIITANAPRPSDPNLKQLLLK